MIAELTPAAKVILRAVDSREDSAMDFLDAVEQAADACGVSPSYVEHLLIEYRENNCA
jgi:hypothetical protein